MNTISSVAGPGYTVPPIRRTANAGKAVKNDTDIFVADAAQEETTRTSQQKKLPQEQAETFARKYNLRNMDRNQFSRLLAELRDSGVLTSQEYSTAYAGTLPQGAGQKPLFPFGKETTDFVQFIDQCAKYCGDLPASPDNEALAAVYSRLNTVLHQIDQTEKTEPAKEESGGTQKSEEHSIVRLTGRLLPVAEASQAPYQIFWNLITFTE